MIGVINMVFKYLLISPSEDGEPNTFMNEEGLQDMFDEFPDLTEIPKFLTRDELTSKGYNLSEMYWKENERVLLKIEFLVPTPKKVEIEWSLDK